MFAVANICHEKSFIVTKIFCGDKLLFFATDLLSRQANLFCNKTFVMTKIILVGAFVISSYFPLTLLEFLVESAMNYCADRACSV